MFTGPWINQLTQSSEVSHCKPAAQKEENKNCTTIELLAYAAV